MKLKIVASIFEIRNIFYIPITKSLFQLINCVNITNHSGEDISVLFGQGNVQCFAKWQIFVAVLMVIWIIPYFASLYVGTLYLQKKKSKQFYVIMFMPLTSITFYLCNTNISTYVKQLLSHIWTIGASSPTPAAISMLQPQEVVKI